MKTATLKSIRTNKTGKTIAKPTEAKPGLRIASILAPVDFSKASLKALSYATTLAGQFDAKLMLLYVIEPVAGPDFEGSFPLMLENDNLIADAKTKLAKLARKHLVDPSQVEKRLVRQGRAYHEITEPARTLKVDLIVMATHGYSGLSHVLLGSVTERVVRHAPCPVLVVRENEHEFIPA